MTANLSVRDRLQISARTTAREIFWSDRDREEYTCPLCGYETQGHDREFDVHHRDGDWLNNHRINLVALCRPCHNRVHRLKTRSAALDAWKDEFLGLGGETA